MPDVRSHVRKNILAIDDDPTALIQVQGILEGSYEVSLAKNFEIARTILEKINVDLILLDMDLPGMSGMDILDLLHKDKSFYFIPVIIVSSYALKDVIVEAAKKGAYDFVVKPVSARILLEKVHTVFNTVPRKISRESLTRKMDMLEAACIKGKQSQVETITADLGHIYFTLDIDQKIAEICKLTARLEYDAAVQKIKHLWIG